MITEVDPPRSYAFRGFDGPVRAIGSDTIEPVGASGSRVTRRLELEGHRLGKLLLPLVRRQARKELVGDYERLKERLEAERAERSPGPPA